MDVLASTPLHHCQVQILSTKMEGFRWKLRCLNYFSKQRRLELKHLCPSQLSAARWRPSSRSSLSLLVLPQLHQIKLQQPLLQEEIAANTNAAAIVDRQHWHTQKQEQRLNRPPWRCPFRHLLWDTVGLPLDPWDPVSLPLDPLGPFRPTP